MTGSHDFDITPGRGLVLVGPAGIGKTTLARSIVADLASTYRVQLVVGSRSALDVPLGAYEAVVPPGVLQARAAIAHLRDEAANAARPSLFFVDDAHDLDDASAFVTRALASCDNVALLLCRRSGAPVADAIDALTREGLVREYQVAPLDDAGVTVLAREHLGGPLGPATAARLAELSGGNPMFAHELVEAGLRERVLVEQGGHWHWNGVWPSSTRLTALVEGRLDALDTSERLVLELIAVAEPVTLPALRHALGVAIGDESFLENVARLERDQLVTIDRSNDDVRVAHPLYGEVLRAEMPHARLHQLAGVLSELPPDERPEHKVRAVRWRIAAGVDLPATELLDAATLAYLAEDLDTAVDLAQRAIDAGAPVGGRRVLAIALEQRGDVRAAYAALDAAAAIATEPEDIVRLALARSEMWLGHEADHHPANEMLDEAEARVPEAHDLILPARILHATLRGEPIAALALAAPALRRGDDESVARVGIAAVLALTVTGRGREGVELGRRAIVARQDLDPEGIGRHALFATALAIALVETGECAEARRLAADGHTAAQRAGSNQAEGWYALARGVAELADGCINDAGAWFADAAARFSSNASPAARWSWAGSALAAGFMGDAQRARQRLAAVDNFGPTCWLFLDPLIARARAWACAAAGEIESSIKILDDAIVVAHEYDLRGLEAVLAEDLVRLNAADRAVAVLDELETVIDNPRVAPWAAHARAMVAGDSVAIVAAARTLDAIGATAEAADALAQAATHAWQRGDTAAATDAAALAREHASRAQGLDTPALRALATTPQLTDRQVEIAALAANGLTSREIADRLVVSVRTVDNHLARVFRVFNVSTRAELAPNLRAWRPDALSTTA